MKINQFEAPQIVSKLRSPAAIRMRFPDGSVYDYIIYDNRVMDTLIAKYKYTPGKLANYLKQNFECDKVR